MAKIGTAHVEIRPVLNEEALEALVKRIEDAIEAGVTRALESQNHARNFRLVSIAGIERSDSTE